MSMMYFIHYILTNMLRPCIYVTFIILTEIVIILNCYGMTATLLTTFVLLYFCNNNITLKIVAVAAETFC
jgi:hypothetical protein